MDGDVTGWRKFKLVAAAVVLAAAAVCGVVCGVIAATNRALRTGSEIERLLLSGAVGAFLIGGLRVAWIACDLIDAAGRKKTKP